VLLSSLRRRLCDGMEDIEIEYPICSLGILFVIQSQRQAAKGEKIESGTEKEYLGGRISEQLLIPLVDPASSLLSSGYTA
jgi:hypothetical protein